MSSTSAVVPFTNVALVDHLASRLGGRTNVVIGYRCLNEEPVQELMFNNARMVNNKIPQLVGDATVTEICICATKGEVAEVQRILRAASKDRNGKLTGKNLADHGRAWMIKFED